MARKLKCARCGVDLEMKKIDFKYFEVEIAKEIPCCPSCGQYFIDQELAEGRMRAAEMELEDK
ncbi:MAG: DNA-binding protein [Clostridia bacterium]|nr:DNA-binding protein [Clostridia bacterium]